MIQLLMMGFLIGMRHALEADHLAALASLSTDDKSTGKQTAMRRGIYWGIGHTLTLTIVGSIFLYMDSLIPEQLAIILESLVGILLIGLGLSVLYKLVKDKVHFHIHKHADGTAHFHGHSHKNDDTPHDAEQHQHGHDVQVKALLVGLMHGMAGSSVLVMLTLDAFSEFWLGLSYMLIFGVGSILGMAVLSVIISFRLRATRHMKWFYSSLQGSVGIVTIVVGVSAILGN